jgi:PAS domain S-box-containing protein
MGDPTRKGGLVEFELLCEKIRAYEHVIETMNCGLVAEDHDGILIFANQQLCDWLGYQKDEIVGKPINQLVPSDLQEFLREDLESAEEGDLRSRLMAIRRKDGTTFPVLTMPQRLLDMDGNPDGFFAVVVDLGAVFTARQVGPPQGLDIRSTLQRISMELQSISYAATTNMLTTLPLNRPELTGLTCREVEVLSILVGGDRVPAIAERLHISPNTVRNHLKSMYRKLGVGSQTELMKLMRSYADDTDAMPEVADT